MNRRRVLRYVAPGIATLAGCNGDLADDSNSNEYVDVEVESVKTDIEDTALSANVIRQASAEGPARLSITFLNEGPERTFTFGGSPPFSHYWSESQEGRKLIAIPDTRNYVRARDAESVETLIPGESTDTFWRATGSLVRLDIALERTLKNQESLTEEFTLLSHHGNENALTSGEYKIEGQEGSVSFAVAEGSTIR